MPLGDDAMTGYLNVDVRHQLADLTSAVDEILALYRLGVYQPGRKTPSFMAGI